MLTKGVVLVVTAGVLLSVGGSWGVASLAGSHAVPSPSSTVTASPGLVGASGKNGHDGKDGVDGTAGANGYSGSNGARGPAGPQGPAGAQGPAGPTGASGASAPTFSAISAVGNAFFSYLPFTFPTQTAAVPAGPALVGFSIGLQASGPPFPVTCSLVNANDPTTVFASTASLAPGQAPAYSTYAATQVVNLTVPTVLAVQCSTGGLAFPMQYQSLSVYAISFAP